MKKVITAVAIAGTIALGGCAGLTPANLSATVAEYEAEVQSDTNLVCGFIPTVSAIISLIPAVGLVTPAAASIAEAICTAIGNAPVPSVQSAKLKSVTLGVPVSVTVPVPGKGNVTISGTFTR